MSRAAGRCVPPVFESPSEGVGCFDPHDHAPTWTRKHVGECVFFFFFTLVTGPSRSLSLKLGDTRVYEPQIRARLGTTTHFWRVCQGRLTWSSSDAMQAAVRCSSERTLTTLPPSPSALALRYLPLPTPIQNSCQLSDLADFPMPPVLQPHTHTHTHMART